jgi:hypothetical protein
VTIPFAVPSHSNVRIAVYDILGREVVELLNEYTSAGRHKVTWNSMKSAGQLSSGIYFVRMDAKEFIKTKKIVLMK